MKRTEVAKTMVAVDQKARCEAIAALRGVPVSVVYYEAIAAHVSHDPRRATKGEGSAVVHRFPKANVRSLATQ